jgi:curved DNA-binding protein
MDFVDYYAELGVKRDASADEIKKAYRKLAKEFHPDKDASPKAQARIRSINEAYEVLGDPEKRKRYDDLGASWKDGPPRGGPAGPGFEELFQQARRQRRSSGGRPRPEDVAGGQAGFSDFFDMLFGRGAQGFPGGAQGFPGGAQGFPGGFGGGFPGGGFPGAGAGPLEGQDVEVRVVLSLEDAFHGGEREIALGGEGQRRSFRVKLPAGVRPGKKIRLKGQGQKGQSGAPNGDLFLVVEHAEHPRFRLEGDDLYTALWVAPWTAALGGKARLSSLDGDVELKVPPGASTGRKIRLRGKGWPTGEVRGDLYAEIKIAVPTELTDEERTHFEALARASRFDPAQG